MIFNDATTKLALALLRNNFSNRDGGDIQIMALLRQKSNLDFQLEDLKDSRCSDIFYNKGSDKAKDLFLFYIKHYNGDKEKTLLKLVEVFYIPSNMNKIEILSYLDGYMNAFIWA